LPSGLAPVKYTLVSHKSAILDDYGGINYPTNNGSARMAATSSANPKCDGDVSVALLIHLLSAALSFAIERNNCMTYMWVIRGNGDPVGLFAMWGFRGSHAGWRRLPKCLRAKQMPIAGRIGTTMA
jgi:hypothetical protein